MIPVIKLTREEVEWCGEIARQRAASARAAYVVDRKYVDDGETADFQGMVGELALSKWLEVKLFDLVGPRRGGVDLQKDGFRFDVKATIHANGRLLTPLRVNADIDIYALALLHRLSELLVVLRGFAFKRELIRPENVIDLGRGPCYALTQDRLHQWTPNISPCRCRMGC